MSESQSPGAPRRLLSELCRAVAERAEAEERISGALAARNEAAVADFQKADRELVEAEKNRRSQLEQEYAAARQSETAAYARQREALEKDYEAARADLLAQCDAQQQAAQQALQDAHWEAMEAADAARGGLNIPMKDLIAGLDERWRQLEGIHHDAVELMRERGDWDHVPEMAPVNLLLEKNPGRRFYRAVEQSQSLQQELKAQFLPKLFLGLRPLGMFFLIWAIAAIPAILWFTWEDLNWVFSSIGVTVFISLAAGLTLRHRARKRSIASYLALRRVMLEAGVGYPTVLEAAKNDCRKLDETIIARHQVQSKQADEDFAAANKRIENRRRTELQRIEAEYPQKMAELDARHAKTEAEIEAKYPPLIRQIDQRCSGDVRRITSAHDGAIRESRERYEREWNEMAEHWRAGVERFEHGAAESLRACAEAFPDWNTDDWARWTPPSVIPEAIPFGHAPIKLSDIERGVPADERLRPEQTDFRLPLYLPFPQRSLLFLKTHGAGRAAAVELMQSAMLRMLTAMPPAKVRFTILDPVGLGDNFSAFMHLADFDEKLVASRIWTDSAHIEQRLADLTKHMENVIQVYLRQEFRSIEEYNAFAGEMAEPYRVLIVANFPANFSEASVHRLKSIISSGARCGVFAILSADAKAAVPRNCQMPELESEGLTLRWSEGHFTCAHPEFGPLQVEFDAPPTVERFKEIVRTVGAAARDSGRVEVPFSCIVPQPADRWMGDSRGGIDVPLGRAGAMKLQYLDLGHGTSQHVLISGKTGSGKSTLLHVLITNLALRYSPDEVELYLVDFKKGVEFKAYARAGLLKW